MQSICLSISTNEDNHQLLTLLDVETRSVEQMALPPSTVFNNTVWSPAGDHIVLTAEDHTLWQVDYPNLEDLEQFTLPISDANSDGLVWSPDGMHLSFFVGIDLYVVDMNVDR